MRVLSLVLLFTSFNPSIALQDATDLSIFNVDESNTPIDLDPNFNLGLVAGIDPGEGLSNQDPGSGLDLFSPQLSVDGSITDGSNTNDLFAESCASTDKLGKRRDGKPECSINELKVPEIPNLDQIIDRIVPAGSTKQEPNSEVNVPNGLPAIDKAKCPGGRPYYLCCICDANLFFLVCQDCLASKLIFFSSPFFASCIRCKS